MKPKTKAICFLSGVLGGILLGTLLIASGVCAKRKMVWDDKGWWYASCYTAQSNTPSGSHQTYSGHRAKEGKTIAVDKKNPIAKMGSKVMLKWRDGKKWRKHVYTVHDYGGFGRYNGGRRAVDVFFEYHGWGVRKVKIFIRRKETKKEHRQRLKRERIKRQRVKERKQKKPFKFVYDPGLFPWQIKTDKKVIAGGAVRINTLWLDVVGHEKGLGNVIKCGDRCCLFGRWARLKDIVEEAVG